MKLILEVPEKNEAFFIELIESLDYIHVVKKIKDERKSKFVQDLAEAFNDVKLSEQGKKKLKKAKDLINEV